MRDCVYNHTPLPPSFLPPPPSHLPHVPHDRVFLSVDKALEHHSDGHVHVVAMHVLPEVHPGMGLRRAYDGLNVPHCDGNTASPLCGEPPKHKCTVVYTILCMYCFIYVVHVQLHTT